VDYAPNRRRVDHGHMTGGMLANHALIRRRIGVEPRDHIVNILDTNDLPNRGRIDEVVDDE